MRRYLIILASVFLVTLVLVVVVRVGGERHALAIGVACGLAASVPGSLAAVFLTGSREAQEPLIEEIPAQPYQPVLIMSGAPQQQRSALPVYMPPAEQLPAPAERRFRIIGEE